MHRVSDGIIWAGTAAIAFGIVVSALLYGGDLPVLLVGLVVLVGAAIVTIRRRRRRIAWARAAMPTVPAPEPRRDRESDKPKARPSRAAPAATTRPPVPPATTTATGIPTGPEARRAGARGASLGDRPPPTTPGTPD